MYQLFAYAKKYESNKLFLIYPKNENFTTNLEPFFYEKENICLNVVCYDLKTDEIEMEI